MFASKRNLASLVLWLCSFSSSQCLLAKSLEFNPALIVRLDRLLEVKINKFSHHVSQNKGFGFDLITDLISVLRHPSNWYCDKKLGLHNIYLETASHIDKLSSKDKSTYLHLCGDDSSQFFDEAAKEWSGTEKEGQFPGAIPLDDVIHVCPETRDSLRAQVSLVHLFRFYGELELSSIYAFGLIHKLDQLDANEVFAVSTALGLAGLDKEAQIARDYLAENKGEIEIGGVVVDKKVVIDQLNQLILATSSHFEEFRKLALGDKKLFFQRAIRVLTPNQLARIFGLEKREFITYCPLPSLTETAVFYNNPIIGYEAAGLLVNEFGHFNQMVIPYLITLLGNPDEEMFQVAGNYFWKANLKSLAPQLLKTLKNPELKIRLSVVNLLLFWHTGNPDGIEVLIEALNDENPIVKAAAVDALSRLGNKGLSAVPHLIRLFGSKEEEVSEVARLAVKEMAKDNQNEILPHLLNAAKSENPKMRAGALYVISFWGNPSTLPLMIKALDEESSFVRRVAAVNIGNLGSKSALAVPKLIEILKNDKSDVVRLNVIGALGKIGVKSKAVEQALLDVLKKDEDHILFGETHTVLRGLGFKTPTP